MLLTLCSLIAVFFGAMLPPTVQTDSVQEGMGALQPGQVERLARVDALMRAAVEEEGAVGLSLGVALGGELVLSAGYGIAELEHGAAVGPGTLFRIGSITKQFSAAAICKLAESGKLYVDDPLSQYVPEFEVKQQGITLRHLLTHTSGIFNYTDLGPAWERTIALDLSHAELLELVSGKPLDFEPGFAYRYSNTGYYLLGMVIERASGKPYARFLQEELFGPLGLERTRYGSNGDLILDRAQGYRYLGDGRFGNDDLISMSQPFAAGSLLSTGGELVRWTLALTQGKVLSAESFEEMTLPYLLENGGESPYGFGLDLSPFRGQPCLSHAGGINGFNSMMYHLPAAGISVAVLSNSEEFNAQAVAIRVIEALAP